MQIASSRRRAVPAPAPAPLLRPSAGGLPLPVVSRRLRDLLHAGGGFTVDPRSARPVRDGLAVAVDPARSHAFPLDRWGHEAVPWLRAARVALDAQPPGGHQLGGWHVDGTSLVCLDIVCVLPTSSVQRARALARRHGQHALYDLGQQALVPVDR